MPNKLDLQKGLTYVPATTLSCMKTFNKTKVNDKNMLWFQKGDCMGKYPYLLLSAYYGSKANNIRETFNMNDKAMIIGDSGGFEIYSRLSKGEKIDYNVTQPRHIVEWYENNNIDIGLGLDIPPMKMVGATQTTGVDMSTFLYNAKKTLQNNLVMQKYRKRYDWKLYNVCHFQINNVQMMERWYNIVNHKDFQSDGWAVSPKLTSNPYYGAYILAFLREKGIKQNVHILGSTGYNFFPLYSYAGQKIKNLTTDSARAHLLGRKYRIYIMDKFNVRIGDQLSDSAHFNLLEGFKQLPCDCPVCSSIKPEQLKKDKLATEFMSAHNMCHFIQQTKLYNSLSYNKEMLIEYLKFHKYTETLGAIDFFDCAMDKGLDKAYNQYKEKFKQKVVYKQHNVFRFK